MYTISKTMLTETAHRLVDYQGFCSHIHGHSCKWKVTLKGEELDSLGMLADFKDLKRIMKETIGPYDHALILCDRDPLYVKYKLELRAMLKSTSGEAARLFIYPWNPTAENLAKSVFDQIAKVLPNGIGVLRVVVQETETSYAEWV